MFRIHSSCSYTTSYDESEELPILSNEHQQNPQLNIQSNDSSHPSSASSGWPWVYWFILKVLCLFHGRRMVSSRKCHHCRLDSLQRKREEAGNTGPLPNYIFPSAIDTLSGWNNDEEVQDENANDDMPEGDQRVECDVCCSMWWDANGKCKIYEDHDIGK